MFFAYKTYDIFKETLLYERETISLEKIQDTLNSKKLYKKFEVKAFVVEDDLIVKEDCL